MSNVVVDHLVKDHVQHVAPFEHLVEQEMVVKEIRIEDHVESVLVTAEKYSKKRKTVHQDDDVLSSFMKSKKVKSGEKGKKKIISKKKKKVKKGLNKKKF